MVVFILLVLSVGLGPVCGNLPIVGVILLREVIVSCRVCLPSHVVQEGGVLCPVESVDAVHDDR